jgi:hypothetical protein
MNMNLLFVPSLNSFTDSIENDAELLVYEIATCYINYTMHGDAITTAVYIHNENYSYIHNIMPSDEWSEDGPWGSESMESNHLLSLKDLIYFIEVINTECRFSQSIREAIEEIIDQNGVPDVSSLKDICEFSSDVYPDLPTYYDIIANYIISYWSDFKRLPDDIEIQNHIMNTLE